MSATTTITKTAVAAPVVDTSAHYGDWRDELFANGYVVIKQAIEPKKARYYVERMLSWLESFGLGYDRQDRSTWLTKNLPYHWKYAANETRNKKRHEDRN